MNNIKKYISVCLSLVLAGCSTLPNEKSGQPKLSYTKYKDELSLASKDRFDLGIALSGGGLRASLFSYGVLKALYDAKILGEIDVISSVSGGGYTAYSLFTSYKENEFGSSLFGNNYFHEETCKLVTTGNFVTLGQMISAGLSLSPKNEAIDLYYRSIGRTYGKNDQGKTLVRLPDFTPKIKSKNIPFLIVNATVEQPTPSGWSDGLFEFTPLWMGNDSYDYYRWSGKSDFKFRQAVAISGAAFAPLLKQTIKVDLPNMPLSNVTLSDGGNSENLGAIALVKRGVDNIIIIDAEHDPNYEFGAYNNFKRRLKELYSEVNISSIEDAISNNTRLDTGLHIGEIVTQYEEGEKISNIYYLKMAMPRSLDSFLFDQESISRGKGYHDRYFSTLEDGKDVNGNWDCSDVKEGKLNLVDWYTYNISSYSKYLNNKSYVKNASKLPGEFFTARFPQYTTVDQSFYLDQALAFIGLGYIEMYESVNAIRKNMSNLSLLSQ